MEVVQAVLLLPQLYSQVPEVAIAMVIMVVALELIHLLQQVGLKSPEQIILGQLEAFLVVITVIAIGQVAVVQAILERVDLVVKMPAAQATLVEPVAAAAAVYQHLRLLLVVEKVERVD